MIELESDETGYLERRFLSKVLMMQLESSLLFIVKFERIKMNLRRIR